MICWRRLVRNYEQRIDVSEAMIFIAMGAPATKKRSPVSFQTDSYMSEYHGFRRLRLKISCPS